MPEFNSQPRWIKHKAKKDEGIREKIHMVDTIPDKLYVSYVGIWCQSPTQLMFSDPEAGNFLSLLVLWSSKKYSWWVTKYSFSKEEIDFPKISYVILSGQEINQKYKGNSINQAVNCAKKKEKYKLSIKIFTFFSTLICTSGLGFQPLALLTVY